ncbi:hypothetical protein ZWY2020_058707 [Hordeum vulgare]|nr:hypothetical protein ZWY2020_058707 [Hordeum vulgare]
MIQGVQGQGKKLGARADRDPFFACQKGFSILVFSDRGVNLESSDSYLWARDLTLGFLRGNLSKTLWLETFKDISTAITHGTGVTRELTDIILRCHLPNQKLRLAVGKPEYKTIIGKSLVYIASLMNLMKVMWGLKNIMHSLVPKEEVKPTKEDRLSMSKGLIMFLKFFREKVNEKIVVLGCVLLDCEYIDKKNHTLLGIAADFFKGTSGFNAEGWDLMKLVTALIFLLSCLTPLFCLSMYKEIVETRECRTVVLRKLKIRVKSI